MLPNTGITTNLVKNTIGAATNSIRPLVINAKSGGTSGLAFNPTDGKKYNNALPYGNLYSNNSPFQWYMPTDAKGVCTGEVYCRTKRTANNNVEYRLGDWRGYNHAARKPKVDLSISSLQVTVKNDNTSTAVIPWTLYSGDYDWRNNFDTSYDNQKVRYIVSFYYGYQSTSSGYVWIKVSEVILPNHFTGPGENWGRNEWVYNMVGSVGTPYTFKATLSMRYEYYPDTVQQQIKPIMFSNQSDVLLESTTIPLTFTKELPLPYISNIWCWYDDIETGDPDYTAAALVRSNLNSSPWSITMHMDSSNSKLDWMFNPNIYISVYDSNGKLKYDNVYSKKFPLRTIPVGEDFTFDVINTVSTSLGDTIELDIK